MFKALIFILLATSNGEALARYGDEFFRAVDTNSQAAAPRNNNVQTLPSATRAVPNYDRYGEASTTLRSGTRSQAAPQTYNGIPIRTAPTQRTNNGTGYSQNNNYRAGSVVAPTRAAVPVAQPQVAPTRGRPTVRPTQPQAQQPRAQSKESLIDRAKAALSSAGSEGRVRAPFIKRVSELFTSRGREIYLCTLSVTAQSVKNEKKSFLEHTLPMFGMSVVKILDLVSYFSNGVLVLIIAWFYIFGKIRGKGKTDWVKFYLFSYVLVFSLTLGQVLKVFMADYTKNRIALYSIGGNEHAATVTPCGRESAGAMLSDENTFYSSYKQVVKGGTIRGL